MPSHPLCRDRAQARGRRPPARSTKLRRATGPMGQRPSCRHRAATKTGKPAPPASRRRTRRRWHPALGMRSWPQGQLHLPTVLRSRAVACADLKSSLPDWGLGRLMVNIAKRPQEADDRAIPGHWEGDLLLGKNNQTAIGTPVERTTGYAMLVHLPHGYKTEHVVPAIATKIKTLPEALRRPLTRDQGIEMREWKQIPLATGIAVYFCDPHAPWQRTATRTPTACCASTSPKAPTS